MANLESEGPKSKKSESSARKRWRLLGNAILKRGDDGDGTNEYSVRRFASFGLLSTKPVGSNESDIEDSQSKPAAKDHCWYEYTSSYHPEYKVLIRHLKLELTADTLNGFNNTGNVCVWPAEETMTHYVMSHLDMFRNKAVCELGGGMTCLAGVALYQLGQCRDILLTDGNEESVENCRLIADRNKSALHDKAVNARVIRWNELDKHSDLSHHFDIILCADCLFFEEYHEDLLLCMKFLLSDRGQTIMFAPKRGGTFDHFVNLARKQFSVTVSDTYDSIVSAMHRQNLSLGIRKYDPDIHFPLMLTLKKVYGSH